MKLFFSTIVILTLWLTACQQPAGPAASNGTNAAIQGATQAATDTVLATSMAPQPSGRLTLTSAAFSNEGDVPSRYGQISLDVKMAEGTSFICKNYPESTNVSPPLNWTNIPSGTVSLALTMVDQMNYAYPDAPPDAIFPHWVVYNIPPGTTGLPEGLPADATLPDGTLQGKNAYPPPYDKGYGGPCPGAEKHHYVFTLYALDTRLALPAASEMKAVLKAVQDHILSQVELSGYYTGP